MKWNALQWEHSKFLSPNECLCWDSWYGTKPLGTGILCCGSGTWGSGGGGGGGDGDLYGGWLSGDTSNKLLLQWKLSTPKLWTNSTLMILCISLHTIKDPWSLIQSHLHPNLCLPVKSRYWTWTQRHTPRYSADHHCYSIYLHLFGYCCYGIFPLFYFLLLLFVYNSRLILAEALSYSFRTVTILLPLVLNTTFSFPLITYMLLLWSFQEHAVIHFFSILIKHVFVLHFSFLLEHVITFTFSYMPLPCLMHVLNLTFYLLYTWGLVVYKSVDTWLHSLAISLRIYLELYLVSF